MASDGDVRVADCRDSDPFSEAVERANARLIAAAPELLAALKAFVAAPLDGKERVTAFYAARAAIAKAEGKS